MYLLAQFMRFRNVPVHDANTNALVRLDLFTYGFTVNFEESLGDLEPFFHAYLKDF